jgi:hypothetical protein
MGADRVIRGGSWNSNARNVRSANRNWNEPGNRNENLGFRPARIQKGPDGPLAEQAGIPSTPTREWQKPNGRRCASSREWMPGERSPASRLFHVSPGPHREPASGVPITA